MQPWMDGYVSDVEYVPLYIKEQEPSFINFCAMMHGVDPVDINNEFTYCELGCGQGMTALVMAANYPQGKFYAVDYNPAHIASARDLAKQAGLNNIVFLEKSFSQILDDPDLIPSCDFITFHGIFSWVSEINRKVIVDVCSRHLKSGGFVYNSYNAKPGWSISEPIQNLLFNASRTFTGNSIQRFEQAATLVSGLEKSGARFFSVNKELVGRRIESLSTKNKHYLVHEYLNEEWRAFYFNEVVEYLVEAKLSFVGQATTTSAYIMDFLPKSSIEFLNKIPDADVRELFKDVIFDTSFRQDIYVRGVKRRLDENGILRKLNNVSWVVFKDDFARKEFSFNLPIGLVNASPEAYLDILNRLRKSPANIAELKKTVKFSTRELIKALMLLYNEGTIKACYEVTDFSSSRQLNKILIEETFGVEQIVDTITVALPSIKSGLSLNRMDAFFYYIALITGKVDSPNDLIHGLAKLLDDNGIILNHQGNNLYGKECVHYLERVEKSWRKQTLPILRVGGAIS